MFIIIKAYSRTLRHFGMFRPIQPNSAPCITLAYLQPCHIRSPDKFRTGSLLKIMWKVDQVYSELCHRTLFNHIQAYTEPCATLAFAETWHTRILEYSELFHRTLSYLPKFRNMHNSDIFKTGHIYSEHSQRFKMENFKVQSFLQK